MMRTIFICLLTLFSFFSNTTIFAQQQEPVVKYIEGRKYFVHIVEKGHTLYAISKKYAVDIDYIVKENPGIENSIKIGQEILIPAMRVKRTEAKNSPEIEGGYLIYTVQKKETAYSISRLHNIPLNALYTANPGIEKGVKDGQQIRIPVQAVRDERFQNLVPAKDYANADSLFGTYYNPDDSLINHIVKAKETMYSICRYYQVHPDSVLKINDGLPLGLLFSDTIRIPKPNPQFKSSVVNTYIPNQTINNEDDPFSNQNRTNNYRDLVSFKDYRAEAGLKDVYKVALMLPLNIEEYIEPDEEGNYKPIDNHLALSFYQGALMAVDSLKSQGLSVDLYVYDTKKSAEHVKYHLVKPEFKNMDMIIGPMYSSVFNIVKAFAHDNNIKIVCPVPQSASITLNSPEVFKAVSSGTTQMRFLANYLLSKKRTANIIAINSEVEKDRDEVNAFVNTYNAKAKATGKDSLWALTLEPGSIEEVSSRLQPDAENILVVPSGNVSFVTDFINRITTIPDGKDFKISVYGMENWLKFDKIDPNYKNRFNVHLTSSYFLDYNSLPAKSFYKLYRTKYKTDPDKFALQGFDITYYYLSGMFNYGIHFDHYAPQFKKAGIQSEFKMFRSSDINGFENICVYLLQYKDFELKRVN